MIYEKDGHRLEEANKFVYLEEIYLIYPKRSELYKSKTYVSDRLVNKPSSGVYNKELGCYVHRSWEMEAAPPDYLKSKGYKLAI